LGITIDRSGIAKLESGRRPVSDIEVAALSKVLKIPISASFDGIDIQDLISPDGLDILELCERYMAN
jgi:hypothetical protein